ncbi:DNA primase [Flavobacterium beibuense F44-8]|uniref:DNA primase n=1 Tax=Flavobacterium beibuense F44-8 TaxID=1406840 RepID=A0A0A2LN73_9FLAO|nr:toprim domain-containing protein [Flavobacterium beibuense]KGO80781.1 DNA primase [Flavobacterium beibuense F44-8]
MDFRKQKLSIAEAKEMDMVQYLSSLGHEPSKIRNNDYWYHSPLREENTASFKVNRKLNRWYDHGLGEGGNIIDFGIAYFGCSVGEFLKKLDSGISFQKPFKNRSKTENQPEHPLKIVKDDELNSYALIHYLEQRKIPVEIATQYCREVYYELNAKNYYGIGFKNDSGGFEIRNPYFKASSSPKDITKVKNASDEVTVFEGFMDFLSFKCISRNELNKTPDFVILNSLSLFEKARPFLESHKSINLYLDNDAAGKKVAREALSNSKRYNDYSKLYQNHKDLNDWLVHIGKQQKKKKKKKKRLGNKL